MLFASWTMAIRSLTAKTLTCGLCCVSQDLPEPLLVTGKQNFPIYTSKDPMVMWCIIHSIGSSIFHRIWLGASQKNQMWDYMDQVRTHPVLSPFWPEGLNAGERAHWEYGRYVWIQQFSNGDLLVTELAGHPVLVPPSCSQLLCLLRASSWPKTPHVQSLVHTKKIFDTWSLILINLRASTIVH